MDMKVLLNAKLISSNYPAQMGANETATITLVYQNTHGFSPYNEWKFGDFGLKIPSSSFTATTYILLRGEYDRSGTPVPLEAVSQGAYSISKSEQG